MVQRTSSLRIEGVSVRYGNNRAVEDVSLTVNGGEFVSLLGPSGCGKTTLLRLIAGFLRPGGGRILCDDRDITTQAPYERRFGVVFQNYALFPHMTAAENVGYGLKVAKVPRSERGARVSRVLDKVGLGNVGDRYPAQLSGGMQQRVALARALVIEPAILLLDEPLSALDKNMREEMQVELRLLQQNLGVTTVFVNSRPGRSADSVGSGCGDAKRSHPAGRTAQGCLHASAIAVRFDVPRDDKPASGTGSNCIERSR